VLESSGGGVAIHADAAGVTQDRAFVAVADSPIDGSADRWRQWDQDDLATFAAHPQDAVAEHFVEVGNARLARAAGAHSRRASAAGVRR
jgi:hypothetical protein